MAEEQSIVGKDGTTLAAVKTTLNVEVAALRGLRTQLDAIVGSVSKMDTAMAKLGITSAKTAAALKDVAGSAPGKKAESAAGTPKPPEAGPPPGTGTPPPGGGGPFGWLSKISNAGKGVIGAGFVAGQMMGNLDQRIDRGMDYASNADRLNVLIQQQSGLSQMQVMQQMRRPLLGTGANPFRIGAAGTNALMQYQAFTGIQATPQLASSVAGIRALTGYSKTTADVLTDQQSVLQPQVANRMFNMLGVNAYTYGGGVNDPMKMRQQITQRMGLANTNILKSAMLPGSVTRARLTDAGVPAELQDEILSYAKSQVQFQKKGGKGMYDPSKEADRRKMGIEENFATQQEETDRLRGTRDENFARRQLDNMAQLERNTQTMVKSLGAIEDYLSGMVGARTSGRTWMKMGGRLLQVAGGITAALGAVPVGAGLFAAGTGIAGDGTDDSKAAQPTGAVAPVKSSDSTRDDSISVPVGYQGGRATLTALKTRADFRSMNPRMQDRLLSLFRANPNVGFGGGMRSDAQQRKLFLDRHHKVNAKTDTSISWDGSEWELNPGQSPAAPPGRSMHQVGLAADLVGDIGWMNANAAKFGLKDFHNIGTKPEPWHVQPVELPNSYKDYAAGGASWGGGEMATSSGSTPSPSIVDGAVAGVAATEAAQATNKSGLKGYIHLFGGADQPSPSNNKTATAIPTGGALTGAQVAQAAYNAGFRGDNLVKMVAIAGRESHFNPGALNPNQGTGDRSYGLWQLNTLNKPGAGMMEDLMNDLLGMPKGNTNFDALYDPQTNANMAYQFYLRNGSTLRPWGEYKGQSATKDTDLAGAAQIVQSTFPSGYGDPMFPERGSPSVGGSTHISHAPTYQITVSPQISFIGTPNSPDLRKIAQEVGSLLTEQVRTLEMRNA